MSEASRPGGVGRDPVRSILARPIGGGAVHTISMFKDLKNKHPAWVLDLLVYNWLRVLQSALTFYNI